MRNEVLRELNRQTHLRTFYPCMLSGKFLKMICLMLQSKRVLEIGTFTGYSAISMAQGLPDDGLIYTIELNEEMESFIYEFISKSGLERKIKLKNGGFIIADNVLWSGKVTEESSKTDKETEGIVEFNEFVKNDSEVE